MRLKGLAGILALLVLGAALWLWVPWGAIAQWGAEAQRGFQNAMARALRAVQRGEPWALLTLCSATFAYGFVHALGPGHGKILLGGAALASGAGLRRMLTLTLVSSLAQSVSAIVLVLGVVWVFQIATADAVGFTERWLAPLSYAAIAVLGAVLVWRGVRALVQIAQAGGHVHDDHCGCGHSHGPSVNDVQSLRSFRDAVALVVSIALRPCTGALFVLVIAARFQMFATGALAVLAMGLGTAAFNGLVAGSGVMARRMAALGEGGNAASAQRFAALLHLMGGGLIVALSLLLLAPHLR